MLAYKLFRDLKDGSITSLFINKKNKLPIGVWLTSEPHQTNGYKFRPFWHCTSNPIAPHLSMKNRSWYIVEMDDYTEFKRPECQGSMWYLSKKIKIIKKLTDIIC